MSQNQIVKFGIVPVIFTLTVATVTQRLTDFQADGAHQQNVDNPIPSSQTFNGERSRTAIATAESSDLIAKFTRVSDRFQEALNKSFYGSTPLTGSSESKQSAAIRSRLSGEQSDSQRHMKLESAEKIKPESESEYLAFFNLNEQLDRLQIFPSQVKSSESEETSALFLSLLSAKTTAWQFLVQEADRVLVENVDRSITTEVNSPNGERSRTAASNQSEAKVVNSTENPQNPEPVQVAIKSISTQTSAGGKTATNDISTVSPPQPPLGKGGLRGGQPGEEDLRGGQPGEDLLFELFGTPDSPGALAIGAAEGTRTATGKVTSSYWGHSDPGNGVNNIGTFSYQHGAPTPRQADWRQLKRLQGQVEEIIRQAQESGVSLSKLELVAGADLLNQSPAAGMSYVHNLKQARATGLQGIDAVLEARVMSFVNPKTGVLEAAGFGNSWEILRQDQWRRLVKLYQTLEWHGAI